MPQTILIVEDNDDLREEVALVLSAENYTVHTAADGREALDALEGADWKPDLIVSDIAMPRMDGYDFFVAVHEIPALRAIPFIFLTARGTRRDVRMGRQLGVDDYLVKPFEPEEFLAVVQNKLQRSAEMREHASRELDDARHTMVQLLSHELRTPLTYVTGGFSLLAEDLQRSLSPDTEVSLSLIRSGTNRLNRLTEQMVLYAELNSGHARMQIERAGQLINVENLVKTVVAAQHVDAQEKRIQISMGDFPDGALDVFGLVDMLAQAVGEVLRNAISYSPEHSEVQVNIFQQAGDAVIQITDHGRGIKAEDVPNVWNVLIQSERHQHEQQGAGMGLPIARLVAELHGGHIELQSTLNEGTTVTIRLPLSSP